MLERRIETRIASRLSIPLRELLLTLLEERAGDRMSSFVWLPQFELGSNSSSANRLLDRLEYLKRPDFPENMLADVPAYQVTLLRRQGKRYYADGMRDRGQASFDSGRLRVGMAGDARRCCS
jgi:hypothetical protein